MDYLIYANIPSPHQELIAACREGIEFELDAPLLPLRLPHHLSLSPLIRGVSEQLVVSIATSAAMGLNRSQSYSTLNCVKPFGTRYLVIDATLSPELEAFRNNVRERMSRQTGYVRGEYDHANAPHVNITKVRTEDEFAVVHQLVMQSQFVRDIERKVPTVMLPPTAINRPLVFGALVAPLYR